MPLRSASTVPTCFHLAAVTTWAPRLQDALRGKTVDWAGFETPNAGKVESGEVTRRLT